MGRAPAYRNDTKPTRPARTWVLSVVCLLASILSIGQFAHAQLNEDLTIESGAHIEELLEKRKTISPDQTFDLADLDLSLIYALEEAGRTEERYQQVEKLEAYLTMPLEEEIKSYVFYTVFVTNIEKGNYEKAFQILNTYDMDENNKDTTLKRYTIAQTIGELYLELGYYERAESIFTDVYENAEYETLPTYASDAVYNLITISNAARKLDKNEAALTYALEAQRVMGIDIENGSRDNLHTVSLIKIDSELAVARALNANGRFGEAIKASKDLLATSRTLGRVETELSATKILGEAYLKLGDHETAAPYLHSIVAHESFKGKGPDDAEIYTDIGKIEEAKGDLEAAIAAYRTASKIRNKWRTELDTNRLEYLTAQTSNAQRAQEIVELRAKQQLSETSIRKTRQLLILEGLLVALALFALAIVVFSYRAQKRAREELRQYASDLEVSEAKARENEAMALANEARAHVNESKAKQRRPVRLKQSFSPI